MLSIILSDYFYPRSPRGERPTLHLESKEPFSNFYPRSPRGERPLVTVAEATLWPFLSTLPSRGATLKSPLPSVRRKDFYPRSPRGERLGRTKQLCVSFEISIHAPLAGSDIRGQQIRKSLRYFYPRSPRGERPTSKKRLLKKSKFLSTLPSRGATAKTNKPLTYFCMEMTKLSVPLLYKR